MTRKMCILLFSHNQNPLFKLILAANRDEFYNRPTLFLDFWKDNPDILAGRDQQEGGTWLGVSKKGRIAAVTNFRDASSVPGNPPSRGSLVTDFLSKECDSETFFSEIKSKGERYNGFNLVAGDFDELFYYSNRNGHVQKLAAGLYGISNRLLNTPWPKLERGKSLLNPFFQMKQPDTDGMLNELTDCTRPPDEMLPHTGVGLVWERILSSVFVESEFYGTRSSSIILITKNNDVTFVERTYAEGKHNTRKFHIKNDKGY